ncbi:6-phosphofructo-2-kinase/fructose-2,6-bisphosphatase-like protein [Gossypium australe]|uniref:6-phosphofructo-2-kinase/fructose-2, 6-bisphosphatase-like protein n=1 Tax=Gossypium australe TaxID=47621 RepID=A0A5B6V7H9_9ROSI|nr:6-phosphofructo-2-kinase/fructose-2,6-bisphosphatase-like protein [Gossypium australe]
MYSPELNLKRVLIHVQLLNRELAMEKGFLDKVEDNAAIRIWSEKTQQEKGDSLVEGFGKVDLVPTVEEYTTLHRCPKIQADKAYSSAANIPAFLKKLMSITGMSKQWVTARIKQKGDSKCIPWKSLWDLILVHLDTKERVDVFALSIYELIIFLKVLRHIDEAVSDQFDQLDKRVTPVPVALLGIWGAIGYAPLLVLKQYRSRQFIPATQGLA